MSSKERSTNRHQCKSELDDQENARTAQKCHKGEQNKDTDTNARLPLQRLMMETVPNATAPLSPATNTKMRKLHCVLDPVVASTVVLLLLSIVSGQAF